MGGEVNRGNISTEILVVEDSPTQADQLRYLLERQNYKVRVACDGRQALDLIEGNKPSLVISDIVMPGMNGYELCHRIKSDMGANVIPVILLTSLFNPEDVLNALAAGADSFLTKPYSEDYLLSNIESILANRNAWKSARERVGVEIMFAGKSRCIATDQQQMFTMLISTYGAAVQRNAELVKVQEELNVLNERLEDLVEERTSALTKEIDEHKRAEEALRESEERYRSLFDKASDGIFIMSPDGKLLEVNESFARMHGYSTEELLRMNIRDLDTPKSARLIPEHMRRLLAGEILAIEVEHHHKDGHVFPLEVSANLISIRGESCIQSFHRDITSRKQAEAEKTLLEGQLQQAIKLEAVGTLAGGIAHDFNNALTGILGFGELLRERLSGNEQALHDLDEILHCGERAAALTRQLLTFARRQVIEHVNLDLSSLVGDLMKLIGRVVGEHIEVKTSLEKDIPAICADRGQIEQVLMNLCLNSRDAMPGGGRLVVETADVYLDEEYVRRNPYMRTGRYALLTVSDTGVGMDEKTCARVFEPFFTTKAPDKGTGLGLAMVYGIVKQHGGFVHLYSEPGKGTAFKVYFPVVDAQPDAVFEKRMAETVRGGTETILLAEDEETIRMLIDKSLKEVGYNVLVARNGEEAIEMFRGNKGIVLAILDMIMPRKGGKEAFEEMHKQNPRLKVIFISGYSATAILDSFVLDSGVPFLQKPFGPTMLARKIREVLDTK